MREGARVGVVIPAAGTGTRMGSGGPKQFLELDGRPIVAWTIGHFQRSAEVDSIVVVAGDAQIDAMRQIISDFHFSKVRAVVAGGARRQDSVWNGLRSLGDRGEDIGNRGADVGFHGTDLVLVHDAVRPFIDRKIIQDLLSALSHAEAALVAIPAKDTIKLAGLDGFVLATPPREEVWIAQTPQACRYADLCAAFELAANDGFSATDEAGLLERLGKRVAIVRGSYDNIKITTPEDLELAKLISRRRQAQADH